MNKELIINKLRSINYSEQNSEQVADQLLSLDDSLNPILSKWISDTVVTDITVEGFSLTGIMDSFHMSFPAALLTIDWLKKEPEIAIDAICSGLK